MSMTEIGSKPKLPDTTRNFPSGLIERSSSAFEIGIGFVPPARLGGEVVRSIAKTSKPKFVTKPRFRSDVIRTSPSA
jgi:hypothetical protein